jgi:hypothetical protein
MVEIVSLNGLGTFAETKNLQEVGEILVPLIMRLKCRTLKFLGFAQQRLSKKP